MNITFFKSPDNLLGYYQLGLTHGGGLMSFEDRIPTVKLFPDPIS